MDKMRFICCYLIAIFFCMWAYGQKKQVAVYVIGTDIEKSLQKVIGQKIVSAVTESGEYSAMERTSDFLMALSRETDYQISGEVRDSQIINLGQKFGVKYIIAADVDEVFQELFIAARLIDVESGLIVQTYDVNGPADSAEELVKLSKQVAHGLIFLPMEREKQRVQEEKDKEAMETLSHYYCTYLRNVSDLFTLKGSCIDYRTHDGFLPYMSVELEIENNPNIKKFMKFPVIIHIAGPTGKNRYTILNTDGTTKNIYAEIEYRRDNIYGTWKCTRDDVIGAYFYHSTALE